MEGEVAHRSHRGTRFTVKVLDQGTDRQRLSVSAEYWVEHEGFKKMWCIFTKEETAEVRWLLGRPEGVGCRGCTHYIESPMKTMGGDDDRMFCDRGSNLVEIRYPDKPACMSYEGRQD